MADIKLTCEGCGQVFTWTDKEQKEYAASAPPYDPSDGDAIGDLLDTEPFCKMCRPKQDGQRS